MLLDKWSQTMYNTRGTNTSSTLSDINNLLKITRLSKVREVENTLRKTRAQEVNWKRWNKTKTRMYLLRRELQIKSNSVVSTRSWSQDELKHKPKLKCQTTRHQNLDHSIRMRWQVSNEYTFQKLMQSVMAEVNTINVKEELHHFCQDS